MGNRYNIEGDSVIFTETEGSGVEYWEYEYNLQNRLSRVRKNGELIAEFLYDADGMRIKAEEKLEEIQESRTTYYVYSYSDSVLMEESASNSSDDPSETKYTSYIYAFAKTFAKVDGIVNPALITVEKIAYFHHDNLGSTRLMTDITGKIVMDQDYMPFGGDLPGVGQVEVLDREADGYKYTGQKEVVSIGLYYYGARYYDPSIGRFITEDTYPGELANPQSQNLYLYVVNNPLRYIDPTGNMAEGVAQLEPIFDLSKLTAIFSGIGKTLSSLGSTLISVPTITVTGVFSFSQPVGQSEEQLLQVWNEQFSYVPTESVGVNGIPLQDQKIEPEILEPPIVPGIGDPYIFPMDINIDTSIPGMEYSPEWLINPGILDFPLAGRSIDDNIMMVEGNKYDVGLYKDIRGVKGLDAHHVGQKAIMKKYVADYVH